MTFVVDIETWRDLQFDLERTSTASIELDARIDAALFGGFPAKLCRDATRRSYGASYIHNDDDRSPLTRGGRHALPITSSVDACLNVGERLFPDSVVTLCSSHPQRRSPFVMLSVKPDPPRKAAAPWACSEGATIPLAFAKVIVDAVIDRWERTNSEETRPEPDSDLYCSPRDDDR